MSGGSTVRGVPVAPQPPDVAAERLGKQGKRGDEGGLGQSQRQDVCSRDRQNDPLSRSDDLAPVARRQRLTHPRQQPPGGEERVACRADREHPRAGRAGDIHAEDEDQERVDLAVEARAQRRRPCASRDPAVDRVQRERDDRERHQHRDRRGLVERVRGQRRDADGERRPSEGHPVGRAQPVGAVAGEAARQCRIHDHAAGDSDHPAGAAEADGPREGAEQQHLGDQPGHRTGLNRSHRASVFVGTWARTPGTRVIPGNTVSPVQLCARGTAMNQDERAPFVRALRRARVSAYAPGEFVEQESFMRAAEIRALADQAGIAPGVSVLDLCCGVAGPGRFITQELGCTYLGVDSSSSAIDIARESAGDLPCRFEVSRIPPIPPGPFDVVLLFETMLAFPDKETLLQEISRALTTGGRFAFTMEEGLPLTEAERESMPDADTVWLTPLQEMLTCLERVGLRVRWQDDCSRVPPCRGGFVDRRVRRRRYGDRRADRAQGTGGAAGRPPALERLAAGRTGPQDRFRCGEDGDRPATRTSSLRSSGSWRPRRRGAGRSPRSRACSRRRAC